MSPLKLSRKVTPGKARWSGPRLLRINASSFAAAHGRLGKLLKAVIARVARKRIAALSGEVFAEQIRLARRCRRYLLSLAGNRTAGALVRSGLNEYFAALWAWSARAQLARVAGRCPPIDGDPVTEQDLGFWLQDDNTGCQTGMLRSCDGNIVFWHTEEDTIGYFDRPRIVAMTVAGKAWHAFVYPYLLPGPAFGWSDGVFQAVDSLSVRRAADDVGCPTCVATWLTWRLAGQADVLRLLQRLRPFVDGCALNVVTRRDDGTAVAGTTYEFGQEHVCARELPAAGGSWQYQANAVSSAAKPLRADESLDADERLPYDARRDRTGEAVERLTARLADDAWPDAVLAMLASRRGGAYAYANDDVETHCVGLAAPGRIEIYAASGSAARGDRFRPQFVA